jgi:hypothetical protein
VNLDRGQLEDLAHRVLWTFVEAFAGFLVAAQVIAFDLSAVESAAGAAVASVLVVVKEYGRRQLAE